MHIPYNKYNRPSVNLHFEILGNLLHTNINVTIKLDQNKYTFAIDKSLSNSNFRVLK